MRRRVEVAVCAERRRALIVGSGLSGMHMVELGMRARLNYACTCLQMLWFWPAGSCIALCCPEPFAQQENAAAGILPGRWKPEPVASLPPMHPTA